MKGVSGEAGRLNHFVAFYGIYGIAEELHISGFHGPHANPSGIPTATGTQGPFPALTL